MGELNIYERVVVLIKIKNSGSRETELPLIFVLERIW
jgi:hypothetical protein